MIVLVEGCDLTGKTTLAHGFEEAFGLDYVHLGPPDTEALAHHLKFVDQWIAAERGIVMDRGHWSGLAYGAAGYNPGNELGDAGFELVDRVLSRLGAVTVHCWASEAQIAERWERGEDYLDVGKVGTILEWMNRAELRTMLPVTRYNLSHDDPELVVNDVARLAGERDRKRAGSR